MVANANPNNRAEQTVPSGRNRSKSWNVPLEELELDRPVVSERAAQRVLRPVPNITTATPAVTASPQRWAQARPYIIAVGVGMGLLLLYLLLSATLAWLGTKADDLQYGSPRTFQLDAYVGHNESAGNPSHFIAINLNHQVDIIELPGGDVSKARAISGPYLFGSGEDLTPVRLEVRDVNGDSKPDLLVNIKNEQVVYINSGTDFHLMTAQERAAITPTQ
jgi:hypothetical protein